MPASAPSATERIENLIESAPWRHRSVAVGLGALLAAVDYFSGPDIIVPTYFVLPVMLLAWNWGTRQALLLALALTLVHIGFLNHWGATLTGTVPMINAALRSSVLLMLAVITARLGTQTRASRERVQLLEGILPTCSFCKDVRNETGDWEQIEAYVSRYSDAQFSHGVCPPCAEKHYGVKMSRPSARDCSAL